MSEKSSRRRPRAGDQTTGKRTLIWHPEVHERWGEELDYLFVAVPDLDRHTAQRTLKDLTDTLGISALCFYTIFGYHDIVLRAWLNSAAKDRLKNYVRSARMRADVLEVSHLEHWSFWKTNLSGEELRELRGKVNTYTAEEYMEAQNAATEVSDAGAPARGLLAEMVGSGLALFETITPPSAIKFFILLWPTGLARAQGDGILRTVREVARDKWAGLVSNLTLCECNGFCPALIKGLAPSVAVLGDAVLDLSDRLINLGVRPVTHIVAGTSPWESDRLSQESLNREYIHHPRVKEKFPLLYDVTLPVDSKRRTFIEGLVLTSPQIENVPKKYEDALQQILVDAATLETSRVTGRLKVSDSITTWLISVEARKRRYLPQLVNALAFAKQEKATKIYHEMNIPKEEREWTMKRLFDWLGDLLSALAEATMCKPLELDAERRDVLRRATEIRNLGAHTDADQNWFQVIKEVAGIMAIDFDLEERIGEVLSEWARRRDRDSAPTA